MKRFVTVIALTALTAGASNALPTPEQDAVDLMTDGEGFISMFDVMVEEDILSSLLSDED